LSRFGQVFRDPHACFIVGAKIADMPTWYIAVAFKKNFNATLV
jgi:hypothetical protein